MNEITIFNVLNLLYIHVCFFQFKLYSNNRYKKVRYALSTLSTMSTNMLYRCILQLIYYDIIMISGRGCRRTIRVLMTPIKLYVSNVLHINNNADVKLFVLLYVFYNRTKEWK